MKRFAPLALLAGCLSGPVSPYPRVDSIPPDVVATAPQNGDTSVPLFSADGGAPDIVVVFSEVMDHDVLTSPCVGTSLQTGVCGPAMVVRFGANESGQVAGALYAEDFDDPVGSDLVRRTRLHFAPANWDEVAKAASPDGGAHAPLQFDARVSGAVTDLAGNRMGHDAHFSWVTAAGP